MRCVNDTFPPRVRFRWLLITMRLSNSSLAGTARTLVAVGIVSERSMFFAIMAAAPRSGLTSSPSAFAGAEAAALGGVGFVVFATVAVPVLLFVSPAALFATRCVGL